MVDEIDLRIIRILEGEGDITFTELARRLKLNESTVRKRVRALKQRGVIKRFTVSVDPAKIGLGTVAIVGIDVEPHKLLEVAERLCELSEAKYVATSTGDHMIMAEIWTQDGKELSRLIADRIGAIEGVKKICPAIILEKLKG